jgi:hypothetical protein
VIEIVGLLLGERGPGIEIAHVEGALDVVLEAGAREREDIDDARGPADALRADARAGLAVDD